MQETREVSPVFNSIIHYQSKKEAVAEEAAALRLELC